METIEDTKKRLKAQGVEFFKREREVPWEATGVTWWEVKVQGPRVTKTRLAKRLEDALEGALKEYAEAETETKETA